MVCGINKDVTQTVMASGIVNSSSGRRPRGSPANYPAPSLFGSSFTTLAVTHNYRSNLHSEPGEHPFSFITWLDVLGAGSQMEVGNQH